MNKEEEEEEEDEEDEMGTSDEELDEDVFRKRKAELTSGAGRLSCKMNGNLFDWSRNPVTVGGSPCNFWATKVECTVFCTFHTKVQLYSFHLNGHTPVFQPFKS